MLQVLRCYYLPLVFHHPLKLSSFITKTSSTRQTLLSTLRSLGYITLELLITPLQYGIPNSRLRYYLLAKQYPLQYSGLGGIQKDTILRHIPGQADWVDPRIDSTNINGDGLSISGNPINKLKDYLDGDVVNNEPHPHAVPEKVLQKWGRLFDIVLPSSRRTCCFTRGYTQLVERAGSILQENDNLNTTEIFDKFFQAQSEADPRALEILKPLRLRYFSPIELLRLFHFIPLGTPSVFSWPEGVSTKTKYRLIGNSVNVEVVERLIEYLFQ
ncbi:S-adenosyl-L-methionine-dependent methyltransferase [Collybia nuda]|uniref:tRNA (cytosine(38)-C(5))-methyltransferase n=1 Tax=Collybia nuda TaxID=64659 RepID=A0A9P5XS81_9AGAR|nr:S-adenosyl-L-methionine-dependent methyltransferase [Collybia nuda]